MRKRKLTRGRKTEVFLFSTGGIVEFENVKNSLRILFLFRFTDVGGLKETGPLLRHALDKQTCIHIEKHIQTSTHKREKWSAWRIDSKSRASASSSLKLCYGKINFLL